MRLTAGCGGRAARSQLLYRNGAGAPIDFRHHGAGIAPPSVIRSVGGAARPAFPVEVGDHALVAPLCALTGCRIGPLCYVATGAIILQGATIGEGSRIGVGAIVHADAHLPANSRVGMRDFAVPGDPEAVITADVVQARHLVQESDFFGAAFDLAQDSASLHREVVQKLLAEIGQWRDEPDGRE